MELSHQIKLCSINQLYQMACFAKLPLHNLIVDSGKGTASLATKAQISETILKNINEKKRQHMLLSVTAVLSRLIAGSVTGIYFSTQIKNFVVNMNVKLAGKPSDTLQTENIIRETGFGFLIDAKDGFTDLTITRNTNQQLNQMYGALPQILKTVFEHIQTHKSRYLFFSLCVAFTVSNISNNTQKQYKKLKPNTLSHPDPILPTQSGHSKQYDGHTLKHKSIYCNGERVHDIFLRVKTKEQVWYELYTKHQAGLLPNPYRCKIEHFFTIHGTPRDTVDEIARSYGQMGRIRRAYYYLTRKSLKY